MPPGTSPQAPTPRRSELRVLVAVLAGVVLAAGGLAFALAGPGTGQAQPVRPAGVASDVPASLAALMQLSPVPSHAAPGFTLTDQDGRTVSLSDFAGRAVVLEFMDSHCTDICPIISQEFVDAYHDLGPRAADVVFVAVNVNPFHAGVADVAAFTHEHRLDTVPSWHFVTGPIDRLQEVWDRYGVTVDAPGPSADVVHSSFVYFVDPTGHERYLGSPGEEHRADGEAYLPGNQIAAWGRGIAAVSESMLGRS